MTNWKIYHNPKCSKSRQALSILEDQNIKPEIIEYLKTPLSQDEISNIIKSSHQSPDVFIRKKEKEFANFRNANLSDIDEIAKIIAQNPKLLERPIVIKDSQAIVARPIELIEDLF